MPRADIDMPYIVWCEGDLSDRAPWGFNTPEAAAEFIESGQMGGRMILTQRLRLRVDDLADWQALLKPAATGPGGGHAAGAALDAATRYRTDAAFHSLVSVIGGFLAHAQFTPTELREAVVLAAVLFEQQHIRPIRPDFLARDVRVPGQQE